MNPRVASGMPDQNPREPEPARLEETVAFLERDGESLRRRTDELELAFHKLLQRLDRIEGRIRDLNEQLRESDPGLEPPPHSAGPDVPRDPL